MKTIDKVADAAIILTVLGLSLWGIVSIGDFFKANLAKQTPEVVENCVVVAQGKPEDVRIVSNQAGEDHYQVYMTTSGEVVISKCE